MTILDLKSLKDYIKNNSNSNSKLSAKNISPKLIKKFFDRYDFEYLGSSSVPYKIEVDLSNVKKITSSCTCPYDKGGICKQRIAAIKSLCQRAITDVFISETKPLTKPVEIVVKNVLPKNQFKLENHLIERNQIVTATYNTSRYYFSYKIESVSPTKIIVQNASYLADNQTYEYKPATQILEITCTCSRVKTICEHTAGSLDKIIDTFGTSIFSPPTLKTKPNLNSKNTVLRLKIITNPFLNLN